LKIKANSFKKVGLLAFLAIDKLIAKLFNKVIPAKKLPE